MIRLRGLPPIIDERVLILGSFPSAASLAAGQYYAHRQNQFWHVLAAILEQPLPDMDYAARQAAVKAAGLAIWDVYAACEREGSLDSSIRGGQPNEFAGLRTLAPKIARICFNGQAAAKFQTTLSVLGYETVTLPSTSPAYTLAFAAKLERWRRALCG